ncbi:hypothetical protein EDB87DRAFT_1726860 [Lactarius vividus]|nr:hypothetical protein EDB87DRAFT_1726860 [Lactarius vividus]
MPTSSSLNKAVERAPATSPQKPLSLPKRQPLSPMKPASSLGAPSRSKHSGLSNLSLALEKLKAPPPSRPATTLGFTRDTGSAIGTSKPTPKAMDDSTVRLGNGLPVSAKMAATPLKRAASVGSAASLQPNAYASGSKTTTVITRPSNLPPTAGPVARISLNSGIVVGKSSFSKPQGFVYGGVGKRRPFEKVSKKSRLPIVEASPVKGSESSRVVSGIPGELPLLSVGHMLPPAPVSRGKDDSQAVAPAPPVGIEPMKLQELQEAFTGNVGVPKADEKMVGDLADAGEAELPDVWKDASRRASLASQFLQQTLAVLPATPPGGSKSTDVVRPQSSSQGTRSGLRSSSGLDVAGSRSASGVPLNGPNVRTHASHLGATAGAPSATKPSSLKVLKSCTIFVDVRTDDGDNAGGLFVDMLRGLGAKIIGRAGQSCTHIVYKNGLMSTLTKYRLMRDPKPLVVGISWVVECTEQRKRVEENDFIVDLEGLNIAGNNKRRRSMLPKHISSNIQSHTIAAPSQPSSSLGGTLMSDQSLDGSPVGADHSLHSSDGFVEDEDDLPPLERARQRRNIFFKR